MFAYSFKRIQLFINNGILYNYVLLLQGVSILRKHGLVPFSLLSKLSNFAIIFG